ncbi:hypothetical protein CSUI_006736 [Cystoisospora suis]|uniref:Transmembrane protein n=1 Tax=Cystoisospora suis TaxID=483139 RepID=A0A2C6KSV8_9APIC|nr:hypothetical protein CSUI_006736 [Cystoisospora suis]
MREIDLLIHLLSLSFYSFSFRSHLLCLSFGFLSHWLSFPLPSAFFPSYLKKAATNSMRRGECTLQSGRLILLLFLLSSIFFLSERELVTFYLYLVSAYTFSILSISFLRLLSFHLGAICSFACSLTTTSSSFFSASPLSPSLCPCTSPFLLHSEGKKRSQVLSREKKEEPLVHFFLRSTPQTNALHNLHFVFFLFLSPPLSFS